jgi:hypothetical protein
VTVGDMFDGSTSEGGAAPRAAYESRRLPLHDDNDDDDTLLVAVVVPTDNEPTVLVVSDEAPPVGNDADEDVDMAGSPTQVTPHKPFAFCFSV